MLEVPETFQRLVLHWTPDRALYIGGHTHPWDARCAGIYAGIGAGLVWLLCAHRRAGKIPPLPIAACALLLGSLLFVDVATLWAKLRAPSNEIRYLTGILFGGNLLLFVYPAFVSLVLRRPGGPVMESWKAYLVYVAFLAGVYFFKSLDTSFAWWTSVSLSVFGFVGIIFLLYGNIVLLFVRSRFRHELGYEKNQAGDGDTPKPTSGAPPI